MATLPECTACIVMMIRVADDGGDDDGAIIMSLTIVPGGLGHDGDDNKYP